MKLTKKLEAEALKFYRAYWDANLNGDMKTFASMLDDNVTVFGSAVSEVFYNKKEALKFYTATADQLIGKAQLRNRKINLQLVDNNILINEQCDFFFLLDKKWTYYGHVRISAVLKHTKKGWKVVQQHASFPDMRADEGEQLAAEKIKEENLQLRDAVKRRTIELEEKNRELEIETALEKVRARTMAMQRSDELSETAAVLFQEFKRLGEKDLLQITIGIYNEAAGVIEFNVTSWAGGGERVNQIFNLSVEEPTLLKPVFTAWKQQRKSIVVDLTGKKLEEWLKYRNANTGITVRSRDTHGRRVVTLAFFSKGHISISSPEPKSPETIQLLERFAGVFDLTYTRFLDLKNAEAQVREAQIEAALERVRSRSIGMQKSIELGEVVHLLDSEIAGLGIMVDNTSIITDFSVRENGLNNWIAVRGKSYLEKFHIPYKDDFVTKKLSDAITNGIDYYTEKYSRVEKNRYFKWLFKYSDFKKIPNDRKQVVFSASGWTRAVVISKNSLLIFQRHKLEEFTEEEGGIFKRFGKVFEQTYTRFLDLQKAEAQGRESQIQLALERVRARTMAMQRSDELADAASLLFKQLDDLGIKSWSSGFNIWQADGRSAMINMCNPDGSIAAPYHLPHTEDIFFIRICEARQRGDELLVMETGGKELEETYSYMFSLPEVKKVLGAMEDIGFQIPKYQINHCAFFAQGYLMFITYEPAPEMWDVFKRLAKVFEQTYTRFLDLQKAEAQARESQIQLALERVRARTMAMQKSDELTDAASLLFKQIAYLGIKLWSTAFQIWNTDNISTIAWPSAPDGSIQAPFRLPYNEDIFFKRIYEARQSGKDFFVMESSGKELEDTYHYMFNLPGVKKYFDDALDSGFAVPKFQITHCAFFAQGYVMFITYEPVPEAWDIFKRFGKVFEQTYTRFLDLQKAETQAREAHIEASLERVRAKTMAMHKSSDMLEVVKTLGEQFELLGFKFNSVNFNTDTHEKDWNLWLYNVGSAMYPGKIHVPYIDHPCFNRPIEAFKKGGDLHSFIFTKEEKDSFFDHIYTNTVAKYGSDERKRFTYAALGFAMSTAVTKNTRITIANFKGEPFSEDENAILRRFANVFEQSYTRFLDLQKAEAQARESQIELGLERVRARAMAMQKSDELSELVDTVFKELTKLDFALTWCIINIIDESSMSNTVWAANPDINKAPESYHMLFEDYPFHHAMMKGWKERKTKDVYVLEGQEKKSYDEYLFRKTEFRKVPEEAQAASRAMEKYVVSFSFSNFGGLQTVGDVPLSDANLDILSRFGKVFDLTYTRFNDLKQAEAQAREAQIEAALERVRSRTMAMHKSDELVEVIQVVFEQLQHLNFNIDTASFSLNYKDYPFNIWMAAPNQPYPAQIEIPAADISIMNRIKQVIAEGHDFFAQTFSYEEKNQWLLHVFEHTIIKHAPAERKKFMLDAAGISISIVLLKQTSLIIGNYACIPYTEEENAILRRFAVVFEQTYTRFLDLQKAEAQARESQIQLALERVRARTMAMQRSEELADVSLVLFQQVEQLGFKTWATGFNVWLEGNTSYIDWVVNSATGRFMEPYTVDLTTHPLFIKISEAKKRGDDFFVLEFEGESLVETYRLLFNMAKLQFEQVLESGFQMPARQINHYVFGAEVSLMFITYEPYPEAHNIFKRFGKVFEQTYTRFLDLKKAEAQAREAKIEAALEKVRSRTMAMQRSAELAEVATVLFQQVKALGVPQWTCGFSIFEIDDNEFTWYPGGPDGEILPPCKIPLTEHPVFISFNESRKRGDELYIYEKTGEAQADHYRYMCSLPIIGEYMQSRLDAGEVIPAFQIDHLANFSHGNLVFITYEHFPEMHDVFKRFAKVFDQTYTRFLDLQKAEAQAREAVKQASVDRVRAEIASMRTTNDLERIQPLIWNELTTLGVPFIRCGVFIMDEKKQQVQSFLSTPDGKSIAAFRQPYNSPGDIAQIVEHWHQKKIYKQHWNEAQFIEFTKNLVQQGAITSGEKYITENRPTDLYLHFLPFLQGMLYAGSTTELSDDELQLVQNLADAFATAYARYEDFNKLELAKEQIEKTLVDLKQTQAQLVQSEKMASLGELTAGIAHEIQNPLNFVNNFSDVNKELLVEMKDEIEKGNIEEVKAIADDIIGNEEKINHHGKRADAIVKGMLQHSRSSSGVKEPTDINVLADEYLRLAYHGLRAKDKSFNATMKTDFDETIGKVNVIPQDMGRVILNLITNAFYVVAVKKKQLQDGFEPTVTVTTKKDGDKVFVSVKDNGNGIPQKVLEKIFQPFFTTKPTGQGTGLGLSLSYDIVKAHGGEIKVETKEGGGSEFIIQIPIVQ